jgi:hypothetical protein
LLKLEFLCLDDVLSRNILVSEAFRQDSLKESALFHLIAHDLLLCSGLGVSETEKWVELIRKH